MRPLLSPINLFHKRLFGRSFGWTGVEIGCHVINLAQVQKVDGRWQLAAVWSIEHPQTGPVESESSLPGEENDFGWLSTDEILNHGLSPTLDRLENLTSLFHGKSCAATLNDGMIAYRELELPSSDIGDSREMVQSEIALETECEVEELLTDSWILPKSNPRGSSLSFGAVSIKKSAALQVASDLLNAGFECQTLDAVPCAMARATSMVVDDTEASTLAVDIGYYQTTLTIVKSGKPIFCRGVRSLGLHSMLENIASAFEISMSDAKTLLFQSANNPTSVTDVTGAFANPLQRKLSAFIQGLSGEIEKTNQFMVRAHHSNAPIQLILMGAGVRIPNVEFAISERVSLPTQSWSIDLSENLFGDQHSATYAIAAGLSALAWEFV